MFAAYLNPAIFTMIMLAIPGLGCKARDFNTSKTEGYFKDTSAAEIARHNGQQTIVAEYEPNQDVLLSHELFSTPGFDVNFAKLILEAGAPRIIILLPKNGSESESKLRASFKNGLGTLFNRIAFLRFGEWSRLSNPNQKASDNINRWSRDYGPMGLRTKDGKIKVLDFNYRGTNDLDETVGRELAKYLNIDRIAPPVLFEGGSFMATSTGTCFITNLVFNRNRGVAENPNFVPVSEPQIRGYFKDTAGCTQLHVIGFPIAGLWSEALPDHLDYWTKLVNDNTIIVSEIWEEAISLITPESIQKEDPDNARTAAELKLLADEVKEVSRRSKANLDTKAREFQTLGFRVLRIPQPIPSRSFLTYTNGLIVNKTMINPRYVRSQPHAEYIDSRLFARYEKNVTDALQSVGLSTKWINSDAIIGASGAIHCASMQFPHVTANISTPAASEDPRKHCVISDASGTTNLRQTTSSASSITAVLYSGQSLQISTVGSERHSIEHVGYVHKSVTSCAQTQCQGEVSISDSNPSLLAGSKGANFRQGPHSTERSFGILTNGTRVEVLNNADNGWLRVMYNGSVSTKMCQ